MTEMERLVASTGLPFILKGVLSARYAQKALLVGAGGIVVSNHGGAIIDYAAHPLEVLPEIKQVIGDAMPIFVDSGIRRGSDMMSFGPGVPTPCSSDGSLLWAWPRTATGGDGDNRCGDGRSPAHPECDRLCGSGRSPRGRAHQTWLASRGVSVKEGRGRNSGVGWK